MNPRRAFTTSLLLGAILAGCAAKFPAAEPDGDADGVPDGTDRCPGLREDGLSPDPHDGCPKEAP